MNQRSAVSRLKYVHTKSQRDAWDACKRWFTIAWFTHIVTRYKPYQQLSWARPSRGCTEANTHSASNTFMRSITLEQGSISGNARKDRGNKTVSRVRHHARPRRASSTRA